MVENNENSSFCSACKGKCCKRSGGIYHPNDFKEITTEVIFKMMVDGIIAIDWWEGDPRYESISYFSEEPKPADWMSKAYYLRTRHIGEPAVHGSYGGQCALWTLENGCPLKFEERPYQCKNLIPTDVEGKNCHPLSKEKSGKHYLVLAWIPYFHIIDKAKIEYYSLH